MNDTMMAIAATQSRAGHAYGTPELRLFGQMSQMTASGSIKAKSEDNSASGCVDPRFKSNPACLMP